MPDIARLIEGYRRVRPPGNGDGGSPDRAIPAEPCFAVIACSDLAVDPAQLTGARPGEMFVIRNLVGMVPPYQPDPGPHGTAAAIEYAVRILGIGQLVVMGHGGQHSCQAVDTLLEAGQTGSGVLAAGDFLPAWMSTAVPALASALRPGIAPAHQARHCQEEIVRLVLENLLSYPWIASRVNDGTLHLHGWHVDPALGTLHILDPASDLFEEAV